MNSNYQAVIGLEVHVELKTDTKIFCSCPTSFGAPPNTHVCPVCMGLPGTLPTLNKKAVEFAIKAGLALGCKINKRTRLDRKNYFYPDLPKAYQISQYEIPLCYDGSVNIGNEKTVGITRIHIEEDAGKLIHDVRHGTMIDYNRCGVPLIEIVSEPHITCAEEAKQYLSELRTILLYTGISDCRMDEGSFRCDVNLSVRKKGDTSLGVRTEIKNINSFAFVAKAIEYEFERQVSIVRKGESVTAETRRFDSSTGKTYSMRTKETAADYRFFPEPDIPSFEISRELIDKLWSDIPELPSERRVRYTESFGLRQEDADIIVSRPQMADFFEAAVKTTKYPRIAANLLLTDLLALVEADGFDCPISPMALSELADLSGDRTVNSSTVKKLIKLLQTEEYAHIPPTRIVKTLGLYQINDRNILHAALLEVVERSPKLLADFKAGKSAAKKAIIGGVMSKTSGLADPIILNEVFEELFCNT